MLGTDGEEKYRIVFSVKYRRPGCVLHQAVRGGTVPSPLFHELFPAETWLGTAGDNAPGASSDLKVYEATREELDVLSVMACAEVVRP